MVLADGELVECSRYENAELFITLGEKPSGSSLAITSHHRAPAEFRAFGATTSNYRRLFGTVGGAEGTLSFAI